MTARTHDLAAFTGLNLVFIAFPLTQMSIATLITVVAANFIGGLFPDLDESTAKIWQHVRGGSVFSKLVTPLLGGHRLISHSLLGMWLLSLGLRYILDLSSTIVLVDMELVWFAFMVGAASHLVVDALTKEGIPLFFPLPWNFGFPPIKFLRLKTGGLIEKSFIFPGLMLLNGYLFYHFYSKFTDFFAYQLTR